MIEYYDLQDTVVDLLEARADFAALVADSSLPGIIADDGSYPKTDGVEDALQAYGLCLVVTEPIEPDFGEASMAGTSHEWVRFAVIVRYRSAIAVPASLALDHWSALDAVRKTLQSQPSSETNTHLRIHPDVPPWSYEGKLGGDNTITVNFRFGHILIPA